MKIQHQVWAGAMAWALGVCSAQAAGLVNGSFEQPSGIPYAALPGGSHTITGWTTAFTGVEWFNTAAYGYGASADGVMAVDLANYVYSHGGLQQTFATVAGQKYTVDFFFGTVMASGRDGTAHLDVTVAGTTRGYDIATSSTAKILWVPEHLTFTAQSDSTPLLFENSQNANAHFALIDGIGVSSQPTVSPVPEPERWALMLAGLGAVGFVRLRVRPSHVHGGTYRGGGRPR